MSAAPDTQRAPAFRLAWSTPPGWVARVEREPLALLGDHAHCELKAAATAHALILKYREHAALVRELSAVSVEEVQHFRAVLDELYRRGGTLPALDESPYARALHAASRAGRTDELLDRLLVAALIEARSLERFWLLAEHLRDASLAELYRRLLPSEASHQGLFLRLARDLCGRAAADARMETLREREGAVVAALPFAPRVHSGLADADG